LYVKNTNCKIDTITLVPGFCEPLEETVNDIEEADIVIIGPGSLYTSVIPNLLIDKIPDKIYNSKCKVFYICNLMTQPGETDGYNVVDHVKAIKKHVGKNIIDFVIANDSKLSDNDISKYISQGSKQVLLDENQIKELEENNIKVISSDFIEIKHDYIRHNATKIGNLLCSYSKEKMQL